jgi:hypothetical protein
MFLSHSSLIDGRSTRLAPPNAPHGEIYRIIKRRPILDPAERVHNELQGQSSSVGFATGLLRPFC